MSVYDSNNPDNQCSKCGSHLCQCPQPTQADEWERVAPNEWPNRPAPEPVRQEDTIISQEAAEQAAEKYVDAEGYPTDAGEEYIAGYNKGYARAKADLAWEPSDFSGKVTVKFSADHEATLNSKAMQDYISQYIADIQWLKRRNNELGQQVLTERNRGREEARAEIDALKQKVAELEKNAASVKS